MVMQDYLHFKQLSSLLRLLRPLARTLGPWPFVSLVFLLLAFLAFASFEIFELANRILEVLKTFV